MHGNFRTDPSIQNNQDNLKEGIVEQRQSAEFEASDVELIETANKWINEAKPLHDKFKKLQKRNEDYYLGNQLDRKRLNQYQACIILNKIWQSLETIIPRATKTLPAPMVSLPTKSEKPGKEIDYRRYAEDLEDILFAVAVDQDLPQKLKEILRYQQLFYLGVLKFGYDKDKGIWMEVIRPQRILLPPNMSDDYVIEFHQDTVKELVKKFPDKEEEIKKSLTNGNGKIPLGTIVGYYEITTNEFKFWKLNDLILKKVENPHYNTKDKKKNHWSFPKKDYIFTDIWQLGISHYSQTTLVDQTITLQDSINKRKRQISDNADHANGTMVAYGQAGITKKEAAALEARRARPNGVVYLKEAQQGSVQHFQGQQLHPLPFEDMTHTISEVDNIFGTHSTIRGEKTPGEETFGGRQLLKESDQERIDELTRMLERVAEKAYNAIAQMIKIHFEKDQYIPYLGEDGTSIQMKIDKDVVKEGVKIRVRQGSTITKDKVSLSREAIVLWQNKAIDPITFFERLGDPRPYRTAKRLFQWTQNPTSLFQEVQAEIDAATKSDEAKQAMESIVEAEMQNRDIVKGKTVPPSKNVTSQHIATHQDLFNTEAFLNLPPEIKENAAKHLEAELQILKNNRDIKQKEIDNEPSINEIIGPQ